MVYDSLLKDTPETTSCVTSSDDDDAELEAEEAYDTFEVQPPAAPVIRQPSKVIRRRSTKRKKPQGITAYSCLLSVC